ncbi:Uncharacterised protein [Kurthia zopfii]|nr:Uncharacterised protein [Kurthia zopfii]
MCLISLIILIVDLKSVNGIEMKLDVIINFIIDPFTGLTTLWDCQYFCVNDFSTFQGRWPLLYSNKLVRSFDLDI